jgi:hypothetical protein
MIRIMRLFCVVFLIPALAAAEIDWDSNGYIKNETALFSRRQDNGAYFSKFENSFNLLINADIRPDLSAHAQFKLIYDGAGVNERYSGHQPYSQHDYVRELYLDYQSGKNYFRLGKQQVVWGTADGIKLLDIINPMDMRELSQNTMEDSRIPVWMLKAEHDLSQHDSHVQVIVAQAKAHRIPGLDAHGDSGHPFIMRGIDTITGAEHGFVNIVPALGATAFAFGDLVTHFTQGQAAKLEDLGGAGFTLQDFIAGHSPFCPGGQPALVVEGVHTCAQLLDYVTQTPGLGGNENRRNLVQPIFDPHHPDSTFEYMPQTSFATFDSFANAQSKYVRDYPQAYEPNMGVRFYQSLGSGRFNYALNYLYHYDPNPALSLHWEDRNGQPLTSYLTTATAIDGKAVTSVRLRTAEGTPFNAADALGRRNDGEAVLVFTERMHRRHSVGVNFDTSFQSKHWGEIVLRGEFLYIKNGRMPVIDRAALAIGDLTQALRSEKSDGFNYVLGADITIFTNLLISPQWIQFWNLDHIDTGNRYSADAALMHLSTNLHKARPHKSMMSLYLSKPFGLSQQGRVNNLIVLEDNGGYWNRFDIEYSFSDRLIATWEWNHYGGTRHSLFGQMHTSSNVHIGLKYLLEH